MAGIQQITDIREEHSVQVPLGDLITISSTTSSSSILTLVRSFPLIPSRKNILAKSPCPFSVSHSPTCCSFHRSGSVPSTQTSPRECRTKFLRPRPFWEVARRCEVQHCARSQLANSPQNHLDRRSWSLQSIRPLRHARRHPDLQQKAHQELQPRQTIAGPHMSDYYSSPLAVLRWILYISGLTVGILYSGAQFIERNPTLAYAVIMISATLSTLTVFFSLLPPFASLFLRQSVLCMI
eukprot:760256-Hanusia_phi.AAC.4